MTDLNSEVARAGEARQILDSALFQAARQHIEGKLKVARQMAPIKDTDLHTRLILLEQMWGELTDFFEQIAQTGQMAELQIRQETERRSMIERGIAMFRKGGRQ